MGAKPVPTLRTEVLAAAVQLDELTDALLTPGPLAARGLAQIRLLLTDGTSPLYYRGAPEDLRAAATRAVEALQPAFSW